MWMDRLRSMWPEWGAGTVYLASVGVLAWLAPLHTNEMLVYGLDDPYIHMAIAANLAEHGNWGINVGSVDPASSSPAWTLLLAGVFVVTGPVASVPMWLNVFGAVVLLAVVGGVLRPTVGWGVARFCLLLLFMVLLPLAPLAFIGMEHTFHAVLAVLLAVGAAKCLSGARTWGADLPTLMILAAGSVAFRFDGMALAGAVVFAMLVGRRYVEAVGLTVAAWLPVVMYALVANWHGQMMLPNSILLKSEHVVSLDWRSWLDFVLYLPGKLTNPLYANMLAMTAAAVALMLWRAPGIRFGMAWPDWVLMIFAVGALLHMQFADLGGFRYEAYLIAVGLVGMFGKLVLIWGQRATVRRDRQLNVGRALAVVALIVVVGSGGILASRGVIGIVRTAGSVKNIGDQQIHMATLVRETLDGQAVALNDIGAVAFYTESRVLDVWGLANSTIAQLRLDGKYGPDEIERLAETHDVHLAVVYDTWLDRYGGTPDTWDRLGQWTIRDNIVCGHETVSLYLTQADTELAERVERFAHTNLPADAQLKWEGNVTGNQ